MGPHHREPRGPRRRQGARGAAGARPHGPLDDGPAGDLDADEIIARFVEQATMVHELGHLLGLVDNGLPMQRDHKDEDHGPHCANDACVMFYLNEGFADAAAFAGDALLRGDRVLFDNDCLDDAAAARE